jgi:hypothetical protein
MPLLPAETLDAQIPFAVHRQETANRGKTASKDGKGIRGMVRKSTIVWVSVAVAGAAAALIVAGVRHWRPHWSIVQGAIIRADADARKQLPIPNVQVTARYGDSTLNTESDASGYFRVAFPGIVVPGQTVRLTFEHENFDPLDLDVKITFRSSLRQLLIVPMSSTVTESGNDSSRASVAVQNVRVRYTVNSQNEENIGSAANTFEVVNSGNVPCRRQKPCSPNGYWKAATGSITMDAGTGNTFRDARVSCIAGPCPFTRVIANSLANDGRTITATALDWSDTTTFLFQAEVYHTAIVSNVRESYPVVFGRGLNFTVPPTAEGVSLVAELGGVEMVFPMGPDLDLSWATCSVRNGAIQDKSGVYQCALKPGFRFQ